MKAKNFPFGRQELEMIFQKSGLPIRFLNTELKDLNFNESEWNKKNLPKLELYLNELESNLQNGKNLFIVSEDIISAEAIATIVAKNICLILMQWNSKFEMNEAIRQGFRIFYLSFLKLQDLFNISKFDSEAKAKKDEIFNSKILIFSGFDSLIELRGEDARILTWLKTILRERSLNLKLSIFVSSLALSQLVEQKSLIELVTTIRSNCLALNFFFDHEKNS